MIYSSTLGIPNICTVYCEPNSTGTNLPTYFLLPTTGKIQECKTEQITKKKTENRHDSNNSRSERFVELLRTRYKFT